MQKSAFRLWLDNIHDLDLAFVYCLTAVRAIILLLDGMAAVLVHQPFVAFIMLKIFFSPEDQRVKHVVQLGAAFCQFVLVARRVILVKPADQKAVRLQFLQAGREQMPVRPF